MPKRDTISTPKRYDGVWVGVVEDTTDPEGLGRMRIRVPALHGDGTVDLPWARACLPVGSREIPVVGTVCFVMFLQGDLRFPVYMGIDSCAK